MSLPLIEGEKTAAARDLWRRDPDRRLPALWRHEYLNMLATFTREGGATISEAQTLWRRGIEMFGPREQGVDMESTLVFATENRISAYDAQYIALAQQPQSIRVTEDGRLLRTFPALTRSMQAYAEP